MVSGVLVNGVMLTVKWRMYEPCLRMHRDLKGHKVKALWAWRLSGKHSEIRLI